MKKRCDRCQALIVMEPSGMVCDGEVAEEIWFKQCPFCGRDNSYLKKLK